MTNDHIYKIATRPSKLAVGQTNIIVNQLREANPGVVFEIVPISTLGDRDHTSSLVAFGGTGVFVKELEQAMLEGRADAAVHSLKDVPSGQPEGLSLVSFPLRENSCDVFISRSGMSIYDMPQGFVLGTGSPRRALQLHNIRPDAQLKDIRGNIDTRLAKLRDGEYDAIILARAGLNRLGITPEHATDINVEECIPAIGQGCIGIECRSADTHLIEMLKRINHTDTESCIRAERAFMAAVEGGCKFPLAAHATIERNGIRLHAIIGDLTNGRSQIKELMIDSGDIETQATVFAKEFRAECLSNGINCTL